MRVIYKITNKINGKLYIGQTKNTLSKRWAQHCQPKRRSILNDAIKKYHTDSFSIVELGVYETLEQTNDAEQYFIDYYNCMAPNGYNLHTGGKVYQVSAITRENLSKAHSGKKAPWNSYKRSLATRAKMSAAQTGRKGYWSGKYRDPKTLRHAAVVCTTSGVSYYSMTEAADMLGLSKKSIWAVCNGKIKSTKGLSFRYVK